MVHTLQDLAHLTKAELQGDPLLEISGISSLETAEAKDLTYMAQSKYGPQKLNALKKTLAGAVIIDASTEREEGRNYLIHPNPSLAFQMAAEALLDLPDPSSGFTNIHPTAVIHESAKLAENVTIGPYCVIDRDVVIGEGTVLDSHVTLYPGVTIGADCRFYSQVVVRNHCFIGNRVILQPGVVIGSCGFGYTMNEKGEHVKLNQVGTVHVEDDVEIGANSAVDRARFDCTVIGKGTKIDNLVQIGHNVRLGPHNIICGQVGMAGSTETGHHVVLAGQAGVIGHIKLGNGVVVGACAGVIRSLEEPGEYVGQPAIPVKEALRQHVQMRNLGKMSEKLNELQKQIDELTSE